MKKLLFAVMAAVLALTLCAGAAQFEKTAQYTDGMFSDVKSDAWYKEYVQNAYELTFMNGTGDGVFSPEGNVTLAQAITVATRVNAIYNGKTAPTNSTSGAWYDSYVAYALENGIILKDEYDSYTRNATRAEVALIFARALPADYYNAINNVTRVPDMPKSNKGAAELLMLYNAGVVMGNDEYGTFNPASDIKRSEMSAIIGRAALPETRLKKDLVLADYPDAYFLIDEHNGVYQQSAVDVYDTAWFYENRNLTKTVSNNHTTFADTSTEFPITVWRDLDDVSEGLLTVEAKVKFTSAEGDGVYMAVTDDEKEDLFRFELKGGKLLLNGVETIPFDGLQKNFRLDMNLDNDTSKLYIDGKYIGDYKLYDKTAGRFYVGTTKEAANVRFDMPKLAVYTNYLVNEKFITIGEGLVPEYWDVTGDFKVAEAGGQGYTDRLSMKVDAKAGSKHVAKHTFPKISGNVVFETYVLMPTLANGATVSLNAGNESVSSMTINGDAIYTANGTKLRHHTNNIWQCLRIETNTVKNTTTYKINGKIVGTYANNSKATYADNVTITFAPDKDASLTFDDVEVYLTHEYDDYCPEPVPAFSDEYEVMINICSLWRQGYHSGWEAVSAYEDKETYLGFYDEGIPEVADWEIKYMVEHGIEVQHYCVYGIANDTQEPIKKANLNDALHDGFFNAKYSDMMRFTFMWENSNMHVTSLENFKKYVWPYWVDYYFTDPRFFTVENKPVMTIWNLAKFEEAFGGEEGAREARAFMEEDIKKYGFDGMIILFADSHSQEEATFKKMTALGGDGGYAYHWQQDGILSSTAMKRLENNASFGTHVIPTASVGFNNIGWALGRKPMASLEEHKKQLEYIRDEYLPRFENEETWKQQLVLISTWNEYGEGTYVMPAGVHGFGYLDNVRKVLVDDVDTTPYNVKPTENQKSRLGHMYTGARTTLANTDYIKDSSSEKIPQKVVKELDLSSWNKSFGYSEFTNDGKTIVTVPNANDSGFYNVASEKAIEVDASEVEYILIRAKATEKTGAEVFFSTASEPADNQKRSYAFTIEKSDEFKDYYISTQSNINWKGMITKLRFDLTGNQQVPVTVERIALMAMSEDQKSYTIYVDGRKYTPCKSAVSENGECYVVAEPYNGFFSLHNIYYEWSRFTGKLYMLTKSGVEIEMNVGSDIALVDGKQTKLAKKFELYDGLPLMPYFWLLNQAKIDNFKVEGSDITVSFIDKKYNDILEARKPFEWEFNIPGDNENWKPGDTTQVVAEDGIMYLTPIARDTQKQKYDPMLTMSGLEIPAANIKKIAVRMRADFPEDKEKEVPTIYFATAAEKNLNEAKTCRVDILREDRKEFKEYIFDFSGNIAWAGTITQLRFDFLGGEGSAEIDYIRCIYEEGAEEKPLTSFEIVNGDAEGDRFAFFSPNCDLSIVADSDNPDNKVYNLKSKSKGKSWSYLRHTVLYTPGATYEVSFDVKVLGTVDGNTDAKTFVCVNAVYKQDGKTSTDHTSGHLDISPADGWQKFTTTFKVSPNSSSRSADMFSVFVDPTNELAWNWQIDNVVVKEIKP